MPPSMELDGCLCHGAIGVSALFGYDALSVEGVFLSQRGGPESQKVPLYYLHSLSGGII